MGWHSVLAQRMLAGTERRKFMSVEGNFGSKNTVRQQFSKRRTADRNVELIKKDRWFGCHLQTKHRVYNKLFVLVIVVASSIVKSLKRSKNKNKQA